MVMHSEKEYFPLPREFPCELYRSTGRPHTIPVLHWHDCLELDLILAGQGWYVIGDQTYPVRPGQIFVINNHERHHSFTDSELCLVVVNFEPDFIFVNTAFDYDYLQPFFERNINFQNLIEPDNVLADAIAALIFEIEQEFAASQPGFQLYIKSCLMKILALLYRHFQLEGQIGSELLARQRKFLRIKDAVAYIDANFTESVSLESAAGRAYMNPSYFSSCFREAMHVTFSEYLLSLRLNEAARRLRETDASITEIGSACGFGNMAYFSRAFRQATQLAPTAYRKSAAAARPAAEPREPLARHHPGSSQPDARSKNKSNSAGTNNSRGPADSL